ncbi:hypothetical protein ColTof4_14051 [Colletotrichum tofieldiae]|uniref:Uncharacterized protein n=1 Tax=Colletotrichum tofieldiae TaxID=708197 RepID=A0A166LF91_9PEZI|nr:hypothetical protein CT0861_02460 [Colletotrichum tofieldiae]GKT67347.1 hypothetical protein ColTof3_14686 [Colletotrichum tofieldiae]GKT81628.1 hypothetical protein ColTof4_14051 [Colletotrichum tofieldiae]GKT97602.1 hypothetical protein Ct61P_15452 [Colletotrichum tofieldiae]
MAALEEEEGVRARTPEPALKRDFECLRCLQSAMHGDSSGWCVPASSSRTLKCQRCALGKTPCYTILEGSELRRLAREFLAAKRGNGRPKDRSRATGALRSRLGFEGSLPRGDPQISTQRCSKVAAVAPIPSQPSRSRGDAVVNPSVVAASSGGPVSSTAVAFANEGQVNAIRAAVDSLVGGSLPVGLMPAYRVLMDQYAALLGGQRR